MASRREMIAMTDEEISQYMAEQQTLIIVSNSPNGYPHPMPMWYFADDEGCLNCTTFEKSQKVLNFKRDPKAALLVESGTAYAQLKSVLVYAQAEVIADHDQIVDCLVNINRKGKDLDQAALAKLRESVSQTAQKRVLLKFRPDTIVTWDHSKLEGRY
jgi:nitroimidazol reductase NimA-like FMN-containing flavoprotein (pyridoxamine 5'-phosphate oxidase superfamily)